MHIGKIKSRYGTASYFLEKIPFTIMTVFSGHSRGITVLFINLVAFKMDVKMEVVISVVYGGVYCQQM